VTEGRSDACCPRQGRPEETLPAADCSRTVPTCAQLTIWPPCTSCHSSALTGAARRKAPAGVDFDSFAAAGSQAQRRRHARARLGAAERGAEERARAVGLVRGAGVNPLQR
jgi:hypothetical protein